MRFLTLDAPQSYGSGKRVDGLLPSSRQVSNSFLTSLFFPFLVQWVV